jgi:hypothetical protein
MPGILVQEDGVATQQKVSTKSAHWPHPVLAWEAMTRADRTPTVHICALHAVPTLGNGGGGWASAAYPPPSVLFPGQNMVLSLAEVAGTVWMMSQCSTTFLSRTR